MVKAAEREYNEHGVPMWRAGYVLPPNCQKRRKGRPINALGKFCRNRRVSKDQMCRECRNPKSKGKCISELREEAEFGDGSRIETYLVHDLRESSMELLNDVFATCRYPQVGLSGRRSKCMKNTITDIYVISAKRLRDERTYRPVC